MDGIFYVNGSVITTQSVCVLSTLRSVDAVYTWYVSNTSNGIRLKNRCDQDTEYIR